MFTERCGIANFVFATTNSEQPLANHVFFGWGEREIPGLFVFIFWENILSTSPH